MSVLTEDIAYHKAAGQFLKEYYESHETENLFFSYGFLSQLVKEAKQIARSLLLKDMDYQNAVVAVWFSFTAVTDMCGQTAETITQLLSKFYTETGYPEEERAIVENAISIYRENKYAATKVQKTVSDAINSSLARADLVENIILLKEETNRLAGTNRSELFFLKYYLELFLKKKYYTDHANKYYSQRREGNFHLLEKRIHKLEGMQKNISAEPGGQQAGTALTNKETEDLFKIAFRNYNQLVSVADSKAALLINVNAIIVSVMIAFVLSRIERNIFLLWPTILLLVVCMITILLSILASRPQKNSFLEDKKLRNHQKFFFGSFDLIDPGFRHATWQGYYDQMNAFFNSSKENVYTEIYKESFNVRKVLSKKFNYLSRAYWVFIIGLLFSIIAFVIAIQSHSVAV
jgi:hypothetical protein